MTYPYYECHITLDPEYAGEKVDALAKENDFKTSVLLGDEVFGNVKKLYCTAHAIVHVMIFSKMNAMCDALTANGIPYLRRKIEQIILDERTK